MEKLPKFIERLTYEEINEFLKKFNFEDYDFQKHYNTLEIRIVENKRVYDYVLTDYTSYGRNTEVASALAKKFREFLQNKFGEKYLSAKKLYFLEKNSVQQDKLWLKNL